MAIQWSLVLFTVLTGTAGWMLVCAAVDAVRGRNGSRAFLTALVALVLLVVGGLASVTHLSHPDRMLAALTHPTSGIFVEAVLVGITALFDIVFMLLSKREASASAQKAMLVCAAVTGVLLSFMAGESYIMESTATWNTIALPTAYLCTAVPCGVAGYVLILGKDAEDGTLGVLGALLAAGGVLAAVASLAFAAAAGVLSETALVIGLGSVVCGGIVPAVCGVLLPKRPGQARALGAAALAGALVGALCMRCAMWQVYALAAIGAPFITNFAVL